MYYIRHWIDALRCPVCPDCFGERDPLPYWDYHTDDPVNLRQCDCGSEHTVLMNDLYRNPVVWAAFVEHHIRESNCLIEARDE